jgi:hypothetical protein
VVFALASGRPGRQHALLCLTGVVTCRSCLPGLPAPAYAMVIAPPWSASWRTGGRARRGKIRSARGARSEDRSAQISFAGPAKSELELAQAVASGVLVNVESGARSTSAPFQEAGSRGRSPSIDYDSGLRPEDGRLWIRRR